MSTLRLSDGRELAISAALGDRVEAAGFSDVSAGAQIVDIELSPALLLVADNDLIFVSRRGMQRWMASEIRRVEATEIVPVNGAPVTFAAWGQTSERADFLRAVSRLVDPSPIPPARRSALPVSAPREGEQGVISRIAERYADGAVAALSGIAFLIAASDAPDKTYCDLPGGPLFGPFMWLSGLGFLTAALFSFACRKTRVAKIGCVVGYLLLAGLGTMFLKFHEFDWQEGQGGTRQDALRSAARSAGAGKHVYWLGPEFQDTQPSSMRAGSVTYQYVRDRTIMTIVEVKTPAAHPGRDYGKHSYLRVRLANGDNVVLSINGQTTADRAVLQEARARIEPIPLNVTAGGCN